MSELRTFGGWRERRGFGVAGLSGTQTGGALLAVIGTLIVALLQPAVLTWIAFPLCAVFALVLVRVRGESLAGLIDKRVRLRVSGGVRRTSWDAPMPGMLEGLRVIEATDADGRQVGLVWMPGSRSPRWCPSSHSVPNLSLTRRSRRGCRGGRTGWRTSATRRRSSAWLSPWQWPDTLRLTVYERQPFAHWGEKRLISRSGEIFEVPGAETMQGLPQLSGPDERLAEVIAFHAECMREFAGSGLSVRAVDLSARGSWRLTLASGALIEIGRVDARRRLQRFLDVWPKLAAASNGPPVYVDLRYENGFAMRWALPEAPVSSPSPGPAPAGRA